MKGKFFLPHWDLNHGPLELKASVLPMSYSDPSLSKIILLLTLPSNFRRSRVLLRDSWSKQIANLCNLGRSKKVMIQGRSIPPWSEYWSEYGIAFGQNIEEYSAIFEFIYLFIYLFGANKRKNVLQMKILFECIDQWKDVGKNINQATNVRFWPTDSTTFVCTFSWKEIYARSYFSYVKYKDLCATINP